MTDDEIIAVVQAHKEGKKIQGKSPSQSNVWIDLLNEPIVWDFMYKEYRVAPEPRKPREWTITVDSAGNLLNETHFFYNPDTLKRVRVREVIE